MIDRYETSAYGLGDIKLLGTMWLLDPEQEQEAKHFARSRRYVPYGEKDAKDVFKTFGTNSAGAILNPGL